MDNLRPSLTAIALIWLLAFSLGLLQGLSSEVLARVPIFDSAYYMETCRFVYEAIFDVVYRPNQAHLSAIWPKLSKDLMVNGPVLPVSGALFYLLSHHIPGPQDTAPGAVYQALLHALNSVLVYFLALRLTASRGSAIATGLAWAVYPASLIACGWFMTEPITCFIMLGLVLSFDLWLENVKQDSSRRKIVGWSFAAAAFSSLLLLSRPALVPILFLGIVAALSTKDVRQHFNKNILVGTICGSVIGLLIFQLPWFCFSSHLMPERVPFLNLATGLNLETQGWGFEYHIQTERRHFPRQSND